MTVRTWIPLALLGFVSACDTTAGKWASDVGEYIPGVGERCQGFQCVMPDSLLRSVPEEPPPAEKPLPVTSSPLTDEELADLEMERQMNEAAAVAPPPPALTPQIQQKPVAPIDPEMERRMREAEAAAPPAAIPIRDIEPQPAASAPATTGQSERRKSFPPPSYSY